MGLVAAVLGNRFYWWIDPVGAIALAVYTITNWSGTVLENAGFLFTPSYTKFRATTKIPIVEPIHMRVENILKN